MGRASIKKYYIKNNVIYLLKKTYKRDYLLRLSPPFKGKDRRIFLIKNSDLDDYKLISPQKAQEIVNKKWREIEEEWVFEGKTYKVLDYCNPKSSLDKVSPIYIEEKKTGINYFYCYSQGKVCLGLFHPGEQRVCLYNFKIVEGKIEVTKAIKWTSSKNCKIIYEVLDNGELKKI